MIERFENDETGYLKWVQSNSAGYVVNVDEPQYVLQYPMVHVATHKAISSPARSNYTSSGYLKFCSTDLDALERWSEEKYGRSLTYCGQCMRNYDEKKTKTTQEKTTRASQRPVPASPNAAIQKYDYKNCQSLFGYAANVHIRFKGQCQLCGCGGDPLNFDLWRQMTVEHLIGKSQGGYLKDIRNIVKERFPEITHENLEKISNEIDILNTVTACSFCNSTTSRDAHQKSMGQLLFEKNGNPEEVISFILIELRAVLEKKRKAVQWKLDSVKQAFESNVLSQISG